MPSGWGTTQHALMPDDDRDPLFEQINDAIVSARAPTPRRRRVPRQSISWFGRYRLDDAAPWGDCELVDVSVAGVGALLSAPPMNEHELLGADITMEVHVATGAAVRLELRGAIRNVMPVAQRRVRVGIEFAGLSDTERAILDALERMGIGW